MVAPGDDVALLVGLLHRDVGHEPCRGGAVPVVLAGLEDATAARRYFFESVRAYTELASIRGVGLSLIGLAAAAAVDHRPDAAVRIAAAAEIYASEEGIVNVYGDNPVGRELIDRARASLAAEDVIRATEAGRRLTIAETLEMARPGDPAPA